MITLVVYDSQFGNTEKLAQAMANALKEYGEASATRVDQTSPTEFSGVDLLILGSPIQGWRPSPAMRAFLDKLTPESLRGVKAAAFDTRMHLPKWFTGSGAGTIDKHLRKLGVETLVPPEGFYVSEREGPLEVGEMERAIEWAGKAQAKYEGK